MSMWKMDFYIEMATLKLRKWIDYVTTPFGCIWLAFGSLCRATVAVIHIMDNNKFLDIHNMVFKNILFVYDQNFD